MNLHLDRNPIIEDVCSSDGHGALPYYLECLHFLDCYLRHLPKLDGSEIHQQVRKILTWQDGRAGKPLGPTDEELLLDFMAFGMIGQAFYFLRHQDSPQFCTERERFCLGGQLCSNMWLFHAAFLFASNGFEVEFIREQSQAKVKTPDFKVSRHGLTAFVEANARIKGTHDAAIMGQMVWESLEEKAPKFAAPEFDPGIVAIDISACNPRANETGLPSKVTLQTSAFAKTIPPESLKRGRPPERFVYDVTKDPGFSQSPCNTGNLVSYSIDSLRAVAGTTRNVRALLVSCSMKAVFDGRQMVFPRGSVMAVDRCYPQLALMEVSPNIYLV